jgi:hypothetical protein
MTPRKWATTITIVSFAAAATIAVIVPATASRVPGSTSEDEPRTVPGAGGRRTKAPEYDDEGNLKQPTDYRRWVFVGSNIGLQYKKDLGEMTRREKDRQRGTKPGDFHNVYINPEAYEAFIETGKFPEKTVLVMDVYEANEKDSKNIVSGGFFPGKQLAVEVAVKNSSRPDGQKSDWAYYAFPDPSKPSAQGAFKDADCYQCHRQHAGTDNVWVQFYPLLRHDTKRK